MKKDHEQFLKDLIKYGKSITPEQAKKNLIEAGINNEDGTLNENYKYYI
jgi:hypothetical protein